jgi:hypothetical protein
VLGEGGWVISAGTIECWIGKGE